jgi:hypothetical protein
MIPIKKPLSESQAAKAANPKPWRGWFLAKFLEAVETESKAGHAMIAARLTVFNGEGGEREIRDWLTTAERGASKLRHACACAPSGLARYDAGEISAEMFLDLACQVRLDVEKRRGFADRSVIVDYKPAEAAGVVTSFKQAV